MSTLVAFTLALSIGGAFQQPADGQQAGEMDRLSRSADERLTQSLEELTRLREQIEGEKLPLAEELTALEEKLSGLRREHERITRLVDEGNLGMADIKDEIKEREDELTYVGNMLDDYARNFESKVDVSELQYCGEAIEAVKQVPGDTGLSKAEKFERQLSFVDMSIKRLFDAVGGMRFPGVGVDLEGAIAEGQFAIVGPVAVFSAGPGAATGLVVPQSGSTKPLIRPLEGAMQAGIASLVNQGEGLLPLDPSRGGALKALVQEFNLIHIFEKGGPIMWPLLFASVLALGTVIERLIFLFVEKLRRNPKALDQFFAALNQGDARGAIEIGKKSKFYVVRALGYALSHKETSLASALLYAQARELKRYQRGIPILDTVITLAPLLGLLGTVTGMMGSFSLIGGELSSPGAITGGIAEALIATAFGLGIAITALLPFNFLNTKTEHARHEIESAATQLELIVTQQAVTVMPAAPAVPAGLDHGWPARSAGTTLPPDSQREEREIRRRQLALQRQMAELRVELDSQQLEMQQLAERERGLYQRVDHSGKD